MRRGRQEDSHEFLRYAIDALQKSCLAGYPPKIDPKIAETTWVRKLFGVHGSAVVRVVVIAIPFTVSWI